MNKAYLQGFILGTVGKPDTDNPYSRVVWSAEWEEWQRGWNDSCTGVDTLTSVEDLFKAGNW